MNPIIILHAGLANGTILLFAGIGEIFAERSGILNLGVEGMMLLGHSRKCPTGVTGPTVRGRQGERFADRSINHEHRGRNCYKCKQRYDQLLRHCCMSFQNFLLPVRDGRVVYGLISVEHFSSVKCCF